MRPKPDFPLLQRVSSEKRRKSGGAPGAVAVVGLRQSLDVFNDSFTQSMAANTNATSQKYEMEAAAIKTQDNAVMLVQQQETDLTNDQIVVLINLFQTSTPHSTAYLNIQREDLWKTWLSAQLKRAGNLYIMDFVCNILYSWISSILMYGTMFYVVPI